MRKPAEEWARTGNAHEPIIQKREFELVKMISSLDTRTAPKGEEGYFMEMVFPLYGIRFISLGNDFDSAKYRGDTGGVNVAFKYLASELYSEDLSMKYKSAKYLKFRQCEYQSVKAEHSLTFCGGRYSADAADTRRNA